MPDPMNATYMIFSIRDEEVTNLYNCFPLGEVEHRDLVYIGSGSEHVENYLKAKDLVAYAEEDMHVLKHDTPTKDMRNMAYNAVKLAAKHDMYSSGLDLAVVKKDVIICLGEELEKIEKRKEKSILKLLQKS